MKAAWQLKVSQRLAEDSSNNGVAPLRLLHDYFQVCHGLQRRRCNGRAMLFDHLQRTNESEGDCCFAIAVLAAELKTSAIPSMVWDLVLSGVSFSVWHYRTVKSCSLEQLILHTLTTAACSFLNYGQI